MTSTFVYLVADWINGEFSASSSNDDLVQFVNQTIDTNMSIGQYDGELYSPITADNYSEYDRLFSQDFEKRPRTISELKSYFVSGGDVTFGENKRGSVTVKFVTVNSELAKYLNCNDHKLAMWYFQVTPFTNFKPNHTSPFIKISDEHIISAIKAQFPDIVEIKDTEYSYLAPSTVSQTDIDIILKNIENPDLDEDDFYNICICY